MKIFYNRLRKLSVFIICYWVFGQTGQAQWVTIPDAAFANWLEGNGFTLGVCMNGGNQLDTTCAIVLSTTNLQINSSGISNLYGIQFFKSLSILNCSNNILTSLPTLPTTLTQLDFSHNNFSSCPVLPPMLRILNCSNNPLSSLPHILPDTLQSLACQNNLLTILPTLPTGLQTLGCPNNQLTSLPDLPSTLQTLSCGANLLTSLPTLPSGLVELDCGNNHLTTLPTLPNSITVLYCYINELTSIPNLPTWMSYFECDTNPNLTCLPPLDTIEVLSFTNTGITCLPDFGNVGYSTPAEITLPLCSTNNPNGCTLYNGIAQTNRQSFEVYPNPSSANFYFKGLQNGYNIQVYNLLGEIIGTSKTTSSNYCLSLNGRANGIYFYKIIDDTTIIQQGKLVLE